MYNETMNATELQEETEEVCGITRALEVIGAKWTVLIVRDLLAAPRRFSELERSLVGISPRTLALRLRELEQDGVLERDCSAGDAHPVYRLTAKGHSLSAILDQMRNWGEAASSR
jgi:DNA-binding HxlR family transcriptional regulator